MTSMQSILDQLAQYGFDTSQGIQDWSSEDIASTMGSYYGGHSLGPGDNPMTPSEIEQAFPAAMFTAISPEAVKQSSISHYSPLIQASQSSLLSDLLAKSSGKTARRATGGFSGSGAWDRYQKGVRDVYGKGMGTELSKTLVQKGQSLQSIQDLISQWAEHAGEIAPPYIDTGNE